METASFPQAVSLPPLESPLPGAAPPDRRAAPELRRAQLRAAPPKTESASRSDNYPKSGVYKNGGGSPYRHKLVSMAERGSSKRGVRC
jgi:hypothetical protein